MKTIFKENYKFIILLAISSSLLFLLLQLVINNYFLFDDNATQYLPFYKYNFESLIDYKTIPLINFHQFLGQSYFGQMQTSVLYFPVYIATGLSRLVVGNYYYSIDISVYLHILAASIAFYFLLREIGVKKIIASLVSLIWITYPYFIILSKGWVIITYYHALLPLTFLFFLRLLKYDKFVNIILFALIQALFFYQGYVQNVFYYFFFEFLFLILFFISSKFLFNEKNVKCFLKFKNYIISKIIFIALILPQLIAGIQVVNESASRSTKVSFYEFMAMAISVKNYFFSQFFAFANNIIFAADSEIYFSGILFVLFTICLLSFVNAKFNRSDKKYLLLFGILSFLALLFTTDFYSLFYSIPLFNKFRWPFKYFALHLFFLLLFFSIIINFLFNTKHSLRTVLVFLCFAFIAVNIYLITYKPKLATTNYQFFRKTHKIQNKINENGRIFTIGNINSKKRSKFMGDCYATFFNKYHFAGYDPLVALQNLKFSIGLNHGSNYKGKLNKELFDYLSLWGVKYFVGQNKELNIDKTVLDRLKLIHKDKDIKIYENPYSLPFVLYMDENFDFTFDYLKNPPLHEFGINKIKIKNNLESGPYLLVNVAPLKKFQFYVDGIKKDIRVSSFKNKLIIKVPENSKEISIVYYDKWIVYGFILSGLTFLVLLMILFKNRIKFFPQILR